MIPLKDDTARERVPLLNYLIITINIAVFSRELVLGEAVDEFVSRFGLVPKSMTVGIADGFSAQQHLLPWLTHMFIHGGWLHLLGNLWFLHIFGDNVEDRLGRFRFLVLFFSGGLIAGLAQIVTSPGDPTPMVGASGAISAVIGAYLVLYPRARILTLLPIFVLFYLVRIPAFIFIGLWFGLQLLYGYTSLLAQSQGGGVAWWAHVGGFGAGLILAFLLKAGTVARPRVELARGRVNVLRRRAASGWFASIALAFVVLCSLPAAAVEREQALSLIDKGKGLPPAWTLEDIRIEPAQILYRFRSPDIGAVSVVAEARNPDQPSFAATRHLNLSYVIPAGGLDEKQEMAVGRFMKELVRIVDRNDAAPLFPLPASASSPSPGNDGPSTGPSNTGAGHGQGQGQQAGRDGIDYGGIRADSGAAAGLLVADLLLWLLSLASLLLVARSMVREVAGWGRSVALAALGTLALSALVRFLGVPHAAVQVGMGHPVIASAITLEELPRYGAAGPLLYHALYLLFPAGMESVLRLHTVLSLCNVLLMTAWFRRLVGPGRLPPSGLLACVAFLSLTPLFLRDGNSESLLVPAVFLLFSGALLVQECLASLNNRMGRSRLEASELRGTGRAWLPLAGAVALLALGSHIRPELLLVAPLLLLVTVLPGGIRPRLLPLLAATAGLLVLAIPYVLFLAEAVAQESARGNLEAGRFAPHLMVFDFLWRNLFWWPRFFPAGLTLLVLAALVAALAWRMTRILLPTLLLSFVWMSLYHVDFNDESMLRLHVPGMMMATLAGITGIRMALQQHLRTGAAGGAAALLLLAAGSAVPTAWFVFFPTNFQVQDRLFPQMVEALPQEPVNFVTLIGRDRPDRAWSQASLEQNPNREGAPPVHRFFPSYLLELPLRRDRIMSVTEFRDRPDWSRRTFFFLSAQCYAMREPFGYEEWGVDEDPSRLLHPACRWILVRHVLTPVLLFRIPAHGEFAAPFQWYPPSMSGLTIGLFELKPADMNGPPHRDSFTLVAREYYSRARGPLLAGDFETARKLLEEVEPLLADSTALWDSLASIYFLQGARKDDPQLLRRSLDYLLKIAQQDIHYPGLLKSIGSIHARLKLFLTDAEDAVYIGDRLARDPDDLVGLWLEAVRLFYTHEHYEESLVLLNRILERVDDDPRVYVYVALDNFYLGRKAEAEAAVARAIEVANGSDPDAYYVRSIIVRDRDLDLAASDIERYLDMSEGPDKVRNEVKQKWLRKELDNLRKGNPSPWWKGGGHDEPWTRQDPGAGADAAAGQKKQDVWDMQDPPPGKTGGR